MNAQKCGDFIAELRKERGWTQTILAEKLGIAPQSISKWECGIGYPDVTLFPLIAELFGVDIGVLFGKDKGEKDEEKIILRQNINKEHAEVKPVTSTKEILNARKVCREVYLDEKIENYITDIVFASRYPNDYKLKKFANLISYGGSPRATINLAMAAKAYAFIKRRGYVIPEDVRAIAPDVMRHRIGLTYEAEAENITTEEIINEILNIVEVP